MLHDQPAAGSGRPIVDGASSTPLLDGLGGAARAWIRRQVLARLEGLLGAEDLTDVLLNAWAARGRIAQAARETADNPAAEQLVEVAEQQTTFE